MNAIIVTGLFAEPLNIRKLREQIRRPDCGALVMFEGSTRSPNDGVEVLRLEYEAFESHARAQLEALAREAAARWGLGAVLAVHRTGEVQAGEPSVVVGATSAHRSEAFEAARWLIDTIKADAAIWKKEISHDSTTWVGLPGGETLRAPESTS